MSWAVEVQRPAEKELAAVPLQARERIASALRAMEDDPFPHGVKKLKSKGRLSSSRRRLQLFTVNRAARLVRVGAIGHRKDVYR